MISTAGYPSRLAGRSKNGPETPFDKLKQTQYNHDEKLVINFIHITINVELNHGQLHDDLKDGVILCRLVNQLRPGTIKTVGQKDLSFIKMDNITRFLQGARQLGLEDSHLFETIDLFEAKDMSRVIHTILTLAQLFIKNDPEKYSWLEFKGGSSAVGDAGLRDEAELENKNDPSPPPNFSTLTSSSTLSSNSISSCHNQDDPTSYRDVRDIFTGFYNQDLRVITSASTSTSSSATKTTTTETKDLPFATNELDWYVPTSLQSSSLLSRPPKSPLRTSPLSKSLGRQGATMLMHSSSGKTTPSMTSELNEQLSLPLSPSSSCSSLQSSSSLVSPNTPDSHVLPLSCTDYNNCSDNDNNSSKAWSYRQKVHSNSDLPPRQPSHSTTNTTSSLGRHSKKHQQQLHQQICEEEKIRLCFDAKDGSPTTQYQLGNCIGKGQFGSVYRALDLATGEIVAIKRIKLEDGELDQEMMKEVGILKTMSHINVIQYIGFIRNRHYINIILEYAENGSLMSTLKSFGAFPEKLVASFCIKILNGLDYLHNNQVVHCDLKAANILTTKTGDVKLTDFGVSLNLKIKAVDDQTVSGTPNWMAPEVIELKGASTKADIWSLGCTLVELVTGKPPYADLISMSAMFRIVEDEYPPLPDNISEDMRDFLVCCFQKNPDDRPTAKTLKEHRWIQSHQQHSTATKTSSTTTAPSIKPSVTNGTTIDSKSKQHGTIKSNSSTNSTGQHRRSIMRSSAGPIQRHSQVHSTQSHEPQDDPLPFEEDEDYATHRFIQTSFGKIVECKVCGDLLHEQAIFCEICSLICHDKCKKLAFSCPPKVNEQQPSYDWVFSAKIYNRNSSREATTPRRSGIPQTFGVRRANTTRATHQRQPLASALRDHPQAESIRKYSRALGLTPQEQKALLENPALLSHTMALEQSLCGSSNGHPTTGSTIIDRFVNIKKNGTGGGGGNGKSSHDDQCIIS